MPQYPGVVNALVPVASNLSPIAPNPGESVYLFGTLKAGATQLPVDDGSVAFETVAVGEASIAACLAGRKEAGSPPAVSLEVIFNGNPGTFEIDLQEASVDADAHYLLPSNASYKITSATQKGSNWVAYVDDIPTGGKFQRVYVAALQNVATVGMTAKLTVLA